MNELEKRRDSEYRIKSVGCGEIVCSRPGLSLIDFYRTSPELASVVQERYEKSGVSTPIHGSHRDL